MSAINSEEQAQTLLEDGIQLQKQGDLEPALVCYQKALQANPSLIKAIVRIGDIYAKQDRWQEAQEHFQQVIELKPNNPYFHARMANALVHLNQIEAAISTYENALKLEPNLKSNWQLQICKNLGNVLMEQERFAEAIKYYLQVLKINPELFSIYISLGQAQIKTQQYDRAIETFKQAISMRPKFPKGFKLIGDAFRHQGQLDIASKCYRKAIELKPDAAHLYRLLGDLFTEQNREQDARACYNKALSLE